MVMRLDVAFRVGPTSNSVTVTHSVSGGPTALTLTSGLYMTLADLVAELATQMQTVDADLDASESGGVVTVADRNGDSFSLTWEHPGLRDHLGFDADLSGSSTYTGTLSPNTFVGSVPWEDDGRGWLLSLKGWEGDHQTGGSIKLGDTALWRLGLRYTRDEIAAMHSVLSALLKRYPATWWRDTTNTTAWSFANWLGVVEVTLDPRQREMVREWLNAPGVQLDLRLPLTLLEYV